MTAAPRDDDPPQGQDLLTIDELAASVGITVRTTRYYASRGLLPTPVRRGRVAFYGPVHRARLELVLALQEHGFTLQAIESRLSQVPLDAGVEELALQRAMLTSWTPAPSEALTRSELEAKVGRALSAEDLRLLVMVGGVVEQPEGYVAMPHLHVGVSLLDVDVPVESLGLAEQAIDRHMRALADELTTILHAEVLEPYHRQEHTPEAAARLEQTMGRLRQLTLEAVVSGFQRAANAVITRSLARD